MRSVIVLLFNLFTAFGVALGNASFDAGLAAYQDGKWEAAIQHWQRIVDSGESSGALEYNLGNAHFRLGNLPQAILHYERALRYQPFDRDTQHNLILANRGIIDQITPLPRLGIWHYADRIRDALSPGWLLNALLILNLVTAVLFGGYLLGSGSLRAWSLRGAITALVLLGVGGAWYAWRSSAVTVAQAIVMAEKVDIYSSPSEVSTPLFALHEGTKVTLGEKLSSWVEVVLADGRKGWMPREYAEKI